MRPVPLRGAPLRIFNDWTGLPADARGASVALGNFDGVHLGHRAVIEAAGAVTGSPLGVITFEPHPRQFFAGGVPFRLMNAEARANQLERLGVEMLYELPFDQRIASLTPEEFARQVLCDGLGVRNIAVGQDFAFGRGRAGNAETLRALGAAMGFGVTIVPLVGHEGQDYSSTAIRKALAEGRPGDAGLMLGHWHRIEGEVLHGEKRGRELGFPTANIALDGLHLPQLGVYAVLVDVLTGPHAGHYQGVASIGTRPMFGENTANLEVFLFDFEGQLYGDHLLVALVAYLRPELKFDGIDTLVQQMHRDSGEARAILDAL